VTGLRAAIVAPRAPFPPPRRGRGPRAAGLRYEAALAAALPEGRHGLWLAFIDAAGPGFCQPDLILDLAAGLWVLEAKLTWLPSAHSQLDKLYLPVLTYLWGRHTSGVVVCKNLTSETPIDWVCADLPSALSRSATGAPTVLHWLGPRSGSPHLGPFAQA
jgi:hypothetical protein